MARNTDYYLGAYWGDREESLDECAIRLHNFLNDIKQCGRHFSRWFEKGQSRRAALTRKILLDIDYLRNRLHETCFEVSGDTRYTLGMWNGLPENEGVMSLSISCGSACLKYGFLNTCVISLPEENPGFEQVVCMAVLRPLLLSVIRNWEPEWAVVGPRSLRTSNPTSHSCPSLAWILYLASSRGKVPELAEPAQCCLVAGYGTLIKVIDEVLDADNSSHVAAVKGTYHILKRAGLLGPII